MKLLLKIQLLNIPFLDTWWAPSSYHLFLIASFPKWLEWRQQQSLRPRDISIPRMFSTYLSCAFPCHLQSKGYLLPP